ncbi:ERF family protein [Cupriavidus basilensis]|uniref:ERF family protein n=1 Tax=Cupriavidus basilensis TaxID=68895 RepID=UPI0039F6B747
MKTSDQLDKFAPAFLAAQKAISFAAKDSRNPHFKNDYADLESVVNAVKGALNENGITYIQMPSPADPGMMALTTRLLHESGQWIEDTGTVTLQKNDPQGFGSANTYLRRYALSAVTGVYQADDDGNAGSGQGQQQNNGQGGSGHQRNQGQQSGQNRGQQQRGQQQPEQLTQQEFDAFTGAIYAAQDVAEVKSVSNRALQAASDANDKPAYDHFLSVKKERVQSLTDQAQQQHAA